MAKQMTFDVGTYKYISTAVQLDELPANEDIIGPEPTREFVQTVAEIGIIYPIVLTRYEGNLYLIDGGRRIKAARLCMHEMINANIFEEVNPTDRAAWALILNEQRSDNPVAEFLYYNKLHEQGNYEEISKGYGMNKAHFEKVMSLNKLVHPQEFIEAYQRGKISESTLFGLAKLGGARQDYLLGVLSSTGKVSASDLTEAKQARQRAVLEASAQRLNMQMPQENTTPEPGPMFLVMDPSDLVTHSVFTDFHQAYQAKLENPGFKLYRLVEV